MIEKLELNAEEMTALVNKAMDHLVRHVSTLGDRPAADLEGARELALSLVEPCPSTGTDVDALLEDLFSKYVGKSFNAAGPGYLAYIPLAVGATNRWPSLWQISTATGTSISSRSTPMKRTPCISEMERAASTRGFASGVRMGAPSPWPWLI